MGCERRRQGRIGWLAMAWLRSEIAIGNKRQKITIKVCPSQIPPFRSNARFSPRPNERSHFHRRFRGAFSHT